MAVQLSKTQLPKSRGGRPATPLNSELLDALVGALKSEPMDGDRPAAYGPEQDFDTEGKAGGQARRYKDEVAKALGKKVKANIYGLGKDDKDGRPTGPFRWRIYIPLSVQSDTRR